jgi:hypothetical protein
MANDAAIDVKATDARAARAGGSPAGAANELVLAPSDTAPQEL